MILGPGTGKQLNARKHPNRPKSLGVLGLGSAYVGAGLQHLAFALGDNAKVLSQFLAQHLARTLTSLRFG
jgi:hypothetical protein